MNAQFKSVKFENQDRLPDGLVESLRKMNPRER